MQRGIDPARLAVIGLGQYRPAQENSSEQGRNANRRVVIVVLSGEGNPEGAYSSERGQSETASSSPGASSTGGGSPPAIGVAAVTP